MLHPNAIGGVSIPCEDRELESWFAERVVHERHVLVDPKAENRLMVRNLLCNTEVNKTTFALREQLGHLPPIDPDEWDLWDVGTARSKSERTKMDKRYYKYELDLVERYDESLSRF